MHIPGSPDILHRHGPRDGFGATRVGRSSVPTVAYFPDGSARARLWAESGLRHGQVSRFPTPDRLSDSTVDVRQPGHISLQSHSTEISRYRLDRRLESDGGNHRKYS